MNAKLKNVIERAETWPEWAQDELAAAARDIDAQIKGGTYIATDEELRKLDEALAAVERGEVANDEELEVVFRKPRG